MQKISFSTLQAFSTKNARLATLSVCSLMALSTVFATGCAKYTPALISNLTDSTDKSASTVTTPAEQFGKLDYSGSLATGRYSSTQVLTLDKVKKEVVLQLPIPATGYLDHAQLSLAITKFPGSTLQLDPVTTGSAAGGSVLTLHVPLSILVKDGSFTDPAKLPNGKAIPGVPDGELPSTALSLTALTSIKATMYLGLNVVGLYVNTPIDPFITLQNAITSADGTKTWGYLYTYPASTVGGKDGGFFITVAVPADISRIIEDNL